MATPFQDPSCSNVVPISVSQKAHQACLTCRKQKRKCDKELPRCGLCTRMARQCDYSDPPPAPSQDDFYGLQLRVQELEARLAASTSHPPQFHPESTTNSILNGTDDQTRRIGLLHTTEEQQWTSTKNRFPSIAFLDSESFRVGGVKIPHINCEVPPVVRQILEDVGLQDMLDEYMASVHSWMPIVLLSKLVSELHRPIWELRPEFVALLLAMKLVLTRPHGAVEINQNPIYEVTKKFLTMLEVAGGISLVILQANLLVAWYEFGHAIYPAAYMSAGWCIRYANLLGINGSPEATNLLPLAALPDEKEERCRTWWSALMIDRLVTMESHGYILNNHGSTDSACMPGHGETWGQVGLSQENTKISSSTATVNSFCRLCQASMMVDKVLSHHHKSPVHSEDERFQEASQLYIEISSLATKLTEDAESVDFLSISSPLATTFSALSMLCKKYSCLNGDNNAGNVPQSEAAVVMKSQAVDGVRTVSLSIVEFSQKVNQAISIPSNLDRVSPIIMNALYTAATNYAWLVREHKDDTSQHALESLRQCLRKLGERWRGATEYLRILEAQEFTHMVGGR